MEKPRFIESVATPPDEEDGMTKRTNFETVKEAFNERGYILLESEYINNHTNMKYICPKHPDKELHIPYKRLQRGEGCKYCSHERARERLQMTYNDVKKIFTKFNYELLSTEYINAFQYLSYKCNKHPEEIQKTTYNNIRKGSGCYYCGRERITEKNKMYCGELASNWKGGISPLTLYLRSKLYKWKIESVDFSGGKCVVTGDNFDDIHHLYSFHSIFKETLILTNLPIHNEISKYTKNELKLLRDTCLELHFKYGLGVCLREDIHMLFHSIYGSENNTTEQFEEFKQKYYDGEFEQILK
jgi:hypothetical protein